MTIFIMHRLLQTIGILLVIALVVFVGIHLIGNPVDVLAGPDCNQICRQETTIRLGLDQPIWRQFLTFLWNLVHGDMGRSFQLGVPALGLVLSRLPATLELSFTAMFIAVVIGFPLGLWAGLRRNGIAARLIMGVSVLGFSIPTFWTGILFIMLFAVKLGVLPVTGRGQTVDVLGVPLSILTRDGLRHILMPACTLSLYMIALIIRLVRNGATEVIFADYIRFARAKGLTSARIIGVHVLRNMMIPIITVLGIEFATMIAFAVVTETIFSWPGIGKLIIDAINTLDRPVILAYMMVIATLFVGTNLLVDIVYSLLDPRIRLGEA